MQRAYIKNELARSRDAAVERARVAVRGASGGTASGVRTAGPGATEGADDDGADGNVINIHTFFLGWDSLADEGAILAPITQAPNYVNY